MTKQQDKLTFDQLKKSLNEEVKEYTVISSGSLAVDLASGIGGFPLGRIIETFGPESCIDESTFIPYSIYDREGKLINKKGNTIAHLYKRFTEELTKDFYIRSANLEGCITRNKVLEVVQTGVKPCYQVKTLKGLTIITTKDHKYMTPDGFKSLEDLLPGDIINTHTNKRNKLDNPKDYYKARKTIMVKYHPFFPIKKVNRYTYYRGQVSRAYYEAYLNNMTYMEYINFLNVESHEKINKLKFIPVNTHVHHRDENFNNNLENNLELIDPSRHGKLHSKDRLKNLSFIVDEDQILTIVPVGDRNTYDIKCAYPYNNFIANQFVVHNSGKSTLAQMMCAEALKSGYKVAYLDSEYSLDKEYAKVLGFDIESPNCIFNQPDGLEECLNIAVKLAESGEVDVIVIDSLSSLVPMKEVEGDVGDNTIGIKARYVGQFLRKIRGICSKNDVLLYTVGQLRERIGIIFGDPLVTDYGNAMKFAASMRIRIARTVSKDKLDSETRINFKKNKCAVPFTQGTFQLIHGVGIDKVAELYNVAIEMEIIKLEGRTSYFEGSKLDTSKDKSMALLYDNIELCDKIKEKINEKFLLLRSAKSESTDLSELQDTNIQSQ